MSFTTEFPHGDKVMKPKTLMEIFVEKGTFLEERKMTNQGKEGVMNVQAIDKIDFRKVHSIGKDFDKWLNRFSMLMKQDEMCIGTKHYQGLAYFHNHSYRHILRRGEYMEFVRNSKFSKANRSWNKSYKMIHDSFVAAGLKTDGYTEKHTEIIASVLGIDKDYLVDQFPGEYYDILKEKK